MSLETYFLRNWLLSVPFFLVCAVLLWLYTLVSCQSFLDLKLVMESCCVKETVVSVCCLVCYETQQGPIMEVRGSWIRQVCSGFAVAPWTVATKRTAPEQKCLTLHSAQGKKLTASCASIRVSGMLLTWDVALKFTVRIRESHLYLICPQLSTLIM